MRAHVALFMSLAACGGGAALAPAATPSGGEPATTSTSAPSAAPVSPSAQPSGSAPASPAPALPTAPVEMKPPMATAMVADLHALGLDAAHLPPIEQLDPKTLRSVMKLLTRSLGAKCGDCHAPGDFAAPTRRKKIAAKMWNEFAGKLERADGSPLFCDSCHQGRIKVLDRTDKKALGRWMDASFTAGLHRKDAKPNACETCHVDWNMTFLTGWAK